MQRLRAILQNISHLLWWGSLSVLAVISMVAVAGFFISGRSETDDAFADGRRLLVALDTGEISGKKLSLDKSGAVTAEPSPSPETPAAEPVTEPAAVAEPPPQAAPPSETPPATEPAQETPPAPKPEVSRPPSTTPTAEQNPELTEQTANGRLPVIGKDGTKPWRYYSKSFERTRNQPMVAVVVTGLGVSREITQSALDLPENISLSFSPYARDAAGFAPAVRATGHELLLDLPLQPSNYPATDPGPQGLLLEKGPEDAQKKLEWAMQRFPAFIGFLTPQNESFTANDEGMKALLQSFANRGLMLVMGKEPPRKETRDIIEANKQAATLVSDVMIDEDLSPIVIQQRLTQLEEQAKKNGYAVGVAQAYPLTIQQLNEWAAKLEEKGVMLVPVSAIAKLRFS